MPLSEKRKAANIKWDAKNLKRLSVAFTLEEYNNMKNHVAKKGESANGFIRKAVSNQIERDNKTE